MKRKKKKNKKMAEIEMLKGILFSFMGCWCFCCAKERKKEKKNVWYWEQKRFFLNVWKWEVKGILFYFMGCECRFLLFVIIVVVIIIFHFNYTLLCDYCFVISTNAFILLISLLFKMGFWSL